jgi:hypothetical protein
VGRNRGAETGGGNVGRKRGAETWGGNVGRKRGAETWGGSVGRKRGAEAWGGSVGRKRGAEAWGGSECSGANRGMRIESPCREARGASRGNTGRFTRGRAYSLSSRFGLPGRRHDPATEHDVHSARPGGPGQFQRAEARQAKIARCDVLPEASRAGSIPAGGGPPGKNRTMRCFAYIQMFCLMPGPAAPWL